MKNGFLAISIQDLTPALPQQRPLGNQENRFSQSDNIFHILHHLRNDDRHHIALTDMIALDDRCRVITYTRNESWL